MRLVVIKYFTGVLVSLILVGCTSRSEVNTGDSEFKNGNFKSAVAGYSESLKTKPNDFDLYYGRGRSYQEMGKMVEAQADFERALAIEPSNFQALLGMSNLQLERKNYASALLYATKAEEIPGAPALASLLKWRALHQIGLPEDALKAYGTAIQLDKNFGQAYFNRALLKIALKRNKLACEDFKLAMVLEYPGAEESYQKYCK